MLLIVFDQSYNDFVNWRAKHFPYQLTGNSILYCDCNSDTYKYFACPKNSLYLTNRQLSETDLLLIKLRALIEIEIKNE